MYLLCDFFHSIQFTYLMKIKLFLIKICISMGNTPHFAVGTGYIAKIEFILCKLMHWRDQKLKMNAKHDGYISSGKIIYILEKNISFKCWIETLSICRDY